MSAETGRVAALGGGGDGAATARTAAATARRAGGGRRLRPVGLPLFQVFHGDARGALLRFLLALPLAFALAPAAHENLDREDLVMVRAGFLPHAILRRGTMARLREFLQQALVIDVLGAPGERIEVVE